MAAEWWRCDNSVGWGDDGVNMAQKSRCGLSRRGGEFQLRYWHHIIEAIWKINMRLLRGTSGRLFREAHRYFERQWGDERNNGRYFYRDNRRVISRQSETLYAKGEVFIWAERYDIAVTISSFQWWSCFLECRRHVSCSLLIILFSRCRWRHYNDSAMSVK